MWLLLYLCTEWLISCSLNCQSRRKGRMVLEMYEIYAYVACCTDSHVSMKCTILELKYAHIHCMPCLYYTVLCDSLLIKVPLPQAIIVCVHIKIQFSNKGSRNSFICLIDDIYWLWLDRKFNLISLELLRWPHLFSVSNKWLEDEVHISWDIRNVNQLTWNLVLKVRLK